MVPAELSDGATATGGGSPSGNSRKICARAAAHTRCLSSSCRAPSSPARSSTCVRAAAVTLFETLDQRHSTRIVGLPLHRLRRQPSLLRDLGRGLAGHTPGCNLAPLMVAHVGLTPRWHPPLPSVVWCVVGSARVSIAPRAGPPRRPNAPTRCGGATWTRI
jgi:hypothetical protein